MKPKARLEGGVWLVWCENIGPSPRRKFIDAYRAWERRHSALDTKKQGFVKVEIGL
ncbi:hypothetical protein PT7_P067 (plasmid) [Pusillimonas sp. T7-7]|nr:hypothetical protein PT7_P067 [Pusillimonas sp. T7-7]